jgi:hypothetical protein
MLADDGARRAADHAAMVTPGWSDHARIFAERFVSSRTRFTAEDLRDAAAGIVAEPPDARAWGVVLRTLASQRRIRRIGYGTSRNPGSHARPVAIWEVRHAV